MAPLAMLPVKFNFQVASKPEAAKPDTALSDLVEGLNPKDKPLLFRKRDRFGGRRQVSECHLDNIISYCVKHQFADRM